MPVVVHEEKCKGCELCVAACPYAAIAIQEKKAVLTSECTNCGACIDSCEFEAIAFEGSQERIRMDVAPFKGIYVFIEQGNQTASKVSLELLGKARGLAKEFSKLGKNQLVTAILIGYELGSIVDELIYYGADHVIIVKDEPFRSYQTDIYTKAIVQIAREKKPEILLFGATPQGRIRQRHRSGVCGWLPEPVVLLTVVPGSLRGAAVRVLEADERGLTAVETTRPSVRDFAKRMSAPRVSSSLPPSVPADYFTRVRRCISETPAPPRACAR